MAQDHAAADDSRSADAAVLRPGPPDDQPMSVRHLPADDPSIVRTSKWRCRLCHHEMDAAAVPGAPPGVTSVALRDGDLGMCISCGTVHEWVRATKAFRQMTAAELAALDRDTRAELAALEAVRQAVWPMGRA
jgi:hypothetical protein